ncbi:MAG TPA: ATP-binding protein [Acidobacteriota bacterium]|nr:ATP-binding protein [Acidobacteriota bacterium]
MEKPRNRLFKLGLVASAIALVSLLHYTTSTDQIILHEAYQRFYYIPILLAAFWYGPWIGLLTSSVVCLVYTYHIRTDWAEFPIYTINQYAEIVLYHVVALITGFLSRGERRQRRRAEAVASDLSRAYEQLRETSEQLRRAERLAALGELTAGIAHEIRNPLGSMKGAAEILEKKISADDPAQEFVAIIREETRRLNQTLSEFLQFARPREPRLQTGSLNEVIQASLALIQERSQRQDIEIRAQLDPDLPPLQLDPDQIKQVMLNVMLNSLDVMPEGGTLEVQSGAGAHHSDDSSSQDDANARWVYVEIRDSGPGISEDLLKRVFDPFFTTKSSGMGLGLSMSHRLVENHGGRIILRANSPSGLVSRIELPCTPEPPV